ncbi:hypothetical protein GCK72_005416 [Caenorhabditis remanei]|uniref:Uncharacterized protein n=2 Tax=Caenorhabditis remanei TaxID=31234 RepID=A0A6A5HFC2_CAERE|nr:hypothetical protein GCK72_005416 [Caenorhabditis remanei]KAF1765464.1 hypothetical protein GCK72_005416 [Caenorhabditis remanei]
MRFPITFLLLLMCMFVATANKLEDVERMQQVLRHRNLFKMEISSVSRDQFAAYMATFCMTVSDWYPPDYLASYISWEKIEFLNSVKNVLEESDASDTVANYFHHLGHNVVSNCSIKNEKLVRDSHHEISQDTLFDNYMYDMMTRNEWNSIAT